MDRIDHRDPALKFLRTQADEQGESTVEWTCTTDGNECANTVRGNPMKSTVRWDGDELVISSKGTFNGQDVEIRERWTLAPDGRTITINRHLASSMGETDQTLVLEKR